MLATAIITFREVLEASLIIGIVMASCRGVPARGRWVLLGVLTGLAGASIVAGFAGTIASSLEGVGQEVFNAAILGLAVVMLGFHNIWMASHSREHAKEAATLGRSVQEGGEPPYALAIVIGVAVLREGSETVLFLYGIAAGAGGAGLPMLSGAALGLALGAGIGTGLYFGLLRIPMRHLFAVTNGMILLLAAGLASQSVGFLVQADLLPNLGDAVWDSSSFLTEDSIPGRVLHTLIGYVSRPMGIQVLAYAVTFVVILGLMRLTGPGRKRIQPSVLAAGVGLLSLLMVSEARADIFVRSPIVEYGELEVEHNSFVSFDKRKSGLNNNQSYTNAIGYGVTPWWKTEIEGDWEAPSGSNLRYSAMVTENYFQLAEQGEYWADPGFYAEFAYSPQRNAPNTVLFGPMAEKEWGNTLHTVNLFFGKELGHNRSDATQFSYAWQSRLRLDPAFEPGVEFYGTAPDIDASAGNASVEQHRAGPVVVGQWNFYTAGKIKYELGYLFGLTNSTENGAVRFKFEYEWVF